MPSPVKISDKLLALAREEARGAHRSATAQIEHWATLGRALEVLVAYRQMLAIKRAGQILPIPALVPPDEIHDLLARLAEANDRDPVRARIAAGGTPLYTADPAHPGVIVEIQADGTRTPGHLEGRRFVPVKREPRPTPAGKAATPRSRGRGR